MIFDNRKKWLGFLILLALIGLAIIGRYYYWGTRPAFTYDNQPLPISRRYYPLRHWVWSGLPVEPGAGFIPDPHFSASDPMPISDPLAAMLSVRDGNFRIIDVNPSFNDRTSEIVLLISAGGSIAEYSLGFPERRRVQAVIGLLALPQARLVPYGNQLALLADFFGPAKGIYLIPLPLKSAALALIPVNDPRFDVISNELHSLRSDASTKDQFCETKSKPFVAFYDKYIGSCDGPTSKYPGAATAESFTEFWR